MTLDTIPVDWEHNTGEEIRKSFRRYMSDGFFHRFLAGADILDIGYRGYLEDVQPIFPHAIGVDLDYPGYDGRRLPFADQSQDAVFSSHTLEHLPEPCAALADWFRVLRIGGFMVITVPHRALYERARGLPSRWNEDHRRFYTPGTLLAEIEAALPLYEYRLRYLCDNDHGFDYTIPPDKHATGCYEIVAVVERIARPAYADALTRG